jgi:hypothetical protein
MQLQATTRTACGGGARRRALKYVPTRSRQPAREIAQSLHQVPGSRHYHFLNLCGRSSRTSETRTQLCTPSRHAKMEVAGLVVGGVGLAALFETCMNTFEYVDTGKRYGVDYQKAALKVSVLELRLSRWGQQVRFSETLPEGSTSDQSPQVEALLGQIQMDLEDACKASKRYVLPRGNETGQQVAGSGNLESLGDRFRGLSLRRQNRTSLVKKTRWALRDKKKLDSLIDDIKGSVDSLENLSSAVSAPSPQQRQEVMKDVQELVQPAEIEEPEETNEPIIAVLKEITEGVDGQLREAVDVAATRVASGDSHSNIFTSDKARMIFGDYIANGYKGPVVLADRHTVTSNKVYTTGEAKVQFGNSYGGKSIMDD